ncbi:MAG TPA: hypothetical protein VKQ72_10655 [Aggregatilineales bacterium]|nr:hypothetical protein [Aggregatilineales bacterium]
MEDKQRAGLQWLGEQYYEELRSLRTSEDNLFNWSTSLFLAGLGALTSLKGITGASWSIEWRFLLILGIGGLTAIIISLAYLIRRNSARTQDALAHIIGELGAGGTPADLPGSTLVKNDAQLAFYVRWSALILLGLVLLGLIWLLG